MTLASDKADRALMAIRQKYATTADVAKRLGFNDQWEDLENGGRDMRSSASGAPTRDLARSAGSSAASRDRRRGWDDVETENEGNEPIDYFVEGNPEAWNKLREADPEAYDRVRRFVRDQKRWQARDEPPPFEGRPEPGGTMTDYDAGPGGHREIYDRRRGASDSARAQAWDTANRKLAAWGLDGYARARELEGMQRHGLLPPRPIEVAPVIAQDASSRQPSFTEMFASRQPSSRDPSRDPQSFANMFVNAGRARIAM
jgi:hypothetical protein